MTKLLRMKNKTNFQVFIILSAKKITLLTTSTKKIIGVDGFGLDINGKKKLL